MTTLDDEIRIVEEKNVVAQQSSSEHGNIPQVIAHAVPTKTQLYLMGIGYMLAMGVCGVVLVALGSTLDDLAAKCGTTSTKIGTVFVTRGIGAIIGALGSSKLYLWFQGNYVLTGSLTFLTILLLCLPFNESVAMLHILFLLLGVGTAVTDTGCQIMTRKLHGKTAGPWLGANTVAFGISGALVPLVEIITTNLIAQYYVICFFVLAVALFVYFGPNPESNGRLVGGTVTFDIKYGYQN